MMTAALTPRQREVLLAIQALSVPYRDPPSLAEIAAYSGDVSVVAIFRIVHALEAKGRLAFLPRPRRYIRVLRPIPAPEVDGVIETPEDWGDAR